MSEAKGWIDPCGNFISFNTKEIIENLEQRFKELESELKQAQEIGSAYSKQLETRLGDHKNLVKALEHEVEQAQAQCAAQFKFLLMLRDVQVSGVDFSKEAVDKIQEAFKEVLSPSCGSALLRRLESAELIIEAVRCHFKMADGNTALLMAVEKYASALAPETSQTKDNAPESPKSLGTQKPKEV